MNKLLQYQRNYLKGQAHHIKPAVQVGQKGLTDALIVAVDEALNHHELIKIKFNAFKEEEQKLDILGRIEDATGCEMVGLLGHKAILFRQNSDPLKRKIRIPIRRN